MEIRVRTMRGDGILTTERAESSYGIPVLIIPAKNDITGAEQIFSAAEYAVTGPVDESDQEALDECQKWNARTEVESARRAGILKARANTRMAKFATDHPGADMINFYMEGAR